jgi:hypothetical protein
MLQAFRFTIRPFADLLSSMYFTYRMQTVQHLSTSSKRICNVLKSYIVVCILDACHLLKAKVLVYDASTWESIHFVPRGVNRIGDENVTLLIYDAW